MKSAISVPATTETNAIDSSISTVVNEVSDLPADIDVVKARVDLIEKGSAEQISATADGLSGYVASLTTIPQPLRHRCNRFEYHWWCNLWKRDCLDAIEISVQLEVTAALVTADTLVVARRHCHPHDSLNYCSE